MTAAEVLAQARIHLADTVVTYRWPEAELLGYVNAGMRDIRKQRPDARWDSSGSVYAFSVASSSSDTLTMDDRWLTALAHYVAAQAYAGGNENQASSADAATQLSLYRQELTA